MATSVIPTRQDYQVRAIEDATELDRDSVSETIFQVATEHGLRCKDCTVGAVSGHFIGDGISLTYTFTSARSITFQVEALPNGLFFGATGEEKADRLRDDLKARLASSHKDLEYIEQLDPNPRSTR